MGSEPSLAGFARSDWTTISTTPSLDDHQPRAAVSVCVGFMNQVAPSVAPAKHLQIALLG